MRPRFEPGNDRFFHEVFLDEDGPLFLSGEQEEAFYPDARATLASLRERLEELESSLPPQPDMACAVVEGEPVQQAVFVRGDHNNPGEPVSKTFPAVLAVSNPPVVQEGSGRRELALWLSRPDNPLPARVMVNRIWQGHFGEGLVRTPSNFGKLGDRPVHPDLLDFLARRFIQDGWSIKKMHRRILLSRTYRMGYQGSLEAPAKDPENRLWSKFNRRRLQVEEIRDALLAIDGSLDLAMGGTLQTGTGTDGENCAYRKSLDPQTSSLRMVYLPLRRANLPALLNLFDFGDAVQSQGRRSVTHVAPQALFLMNSDFVLSRARTLAQQLLDSRELDGQRLTDAYLNILNRHPSQAELQAGLDYLKGLSARFPDSMSDADAWSSLCHVLMASNEFIFVD